MSMLGITVPVVLTLKQGEVSMKVGKLTCICQIKQAYHKVLQGPDA